MTVATALKREGRQEGEQIGMEKAATGMLKEGIAIDKVQKITHLSRRRIHELLAQLEHKATTKSR